MLRLALAKPLRKIVVSIQFTRIVTEMNDKEREAFLAAAKDWTVKSAGQDLGEYFWRAGVAYGASLSSPSEQVEPVEPVAQKRVWELDEHAGKLLADMILADDEPSLVTLSVGPTKNDDGTVEHGLRVHLTDYPEEGCILLVNSPSRGRDEF